MCNPSTRLVETGESRSLLVRPSSLMDEPQVQGEALSQKPRLASDLMSTSDVNTQVHTYGHAHIHQLVHTIIY